MPPASVGRPLFKYVVLAMFAVGVLAASSGLFTQSFFSDTQTVSNNAFASGTVDIQTSPASALITALNVLPASLKTGVLTVTNGGTLPLRYAIQASATNTDGKDLRGSFRLRVGL